MSSRLVMIAPLRGEFKLFDLWNFIFVQPADADCDRAWLWGRCLDLWRILSRSSVQSRNIVVHQLLIIEVLQSCFVLPGLFLLVPHTFLLVNYIHLHQNFGIVTLDIIEPDHVHLPQLQACLLGTLFSFLLLFLKAITPLIRTFRLGMGWIWFPWSPAA